MSDQAPGHLVILLLLTSPGLAGIRSFNSSRGMDPAMKLIHDIENMLKIDVKGKCKTKGKNSYFSLCRVIMYKVNKTKYLRLRLV